MSGPPGGAADRGGAAAAAAVPGAGRAAGTVPAGGPPGAPAPWWRRVAAQAGWEVRALLSNGEQLLLLLVLPAALLAGVVGTGVVEVVPATGPLAGAAPVDVVTPGVLALAVMSTAFTGQAIATGFDRRAGVLRLLGTTPLGRDGLLAARVLAVAAVQVVQLAVLGGLAAGLGWRPDLAGVPAAAAVALAGTAAFVALGLLLAGTLRAEATLAAANLAWVLLLLGGGVVVPPDLLPGPLATVAPWLPSGALADGLRSALATGQPAATAGPLLVLAGWAAAGTAAAVRWFRWD